MSAFYIETPDGRASAWLSRGGRQLLVGGGRELRDDIAPPRFEQTGLACKVCYRDLCDMPELLWLLADRRRRRAMRQAYRAKSGRR